MKSELSRALKNEFHRRMASELPEFQKTATAFGGYIYRKRDEERGINIFVFLEPDLKQDRFTLELAASSASDFPFEILPGKRDEVTGAVRYRIRTFLKNGDGWWNVNVSESPRPDIKSILKTFEPESISKGLARMPELVEDAFSGLKSSLHKFLAVVR